MLQEDHQCIHPCQFHTYYVEEDVVGEFHVLEVGHASYHVVHHAYHDVEAEGYMEEEAVMHPYDVGECVGSMVVYSVADVDDLAK